MDFHKWIEVDVSDVGDPGPLVHDFNELLVDHQRQAKRIAELEEYEAWHKAWEAGGQPTVDKMLDERNEMKQQIRELEGMVKHTDALELENAYLREALAKLEGAQDKRIAELEGELSKAVGTLEELRHAWKDLGGDDGQGHYEGDYTVQAQVDRILAKLGTGGGE